MCTQAPCMQWSELHHATHTCVAHGTTRERGHHPPPHQQPPIFSAVLTFGVIPSPIPLPLPHRSPVGSISPPQQMPSLRPISSSRHRLGLAIWMSRGCRRSSNTQAQVQILHPRGTWTWHRRPTRQPRSWMRRRCKSKGFACLCLLYKK